MEEHYNLRGLTPGGYYWYEAPIGGRTLNSILTIFFFVHQIFIIMNRYNLIKEILHESIMLNQVNQNTPEGWFKHLLNQLKEETNPKYSNYIFFVKDKEIYMEYNEKYGYLWCSYDKIWSVFESEFGMNYEETQEFIKDMVEEHYNLRGLTLDKTLYAIRTRAERGLTPYRIK